MTAAAEHFVGRQTFSAITGNPVERDLFDGSSVSPHTDLAAWAEVIVVAPATTNLLGHLANGLADDLLSTLYLCFTGPVMIAPAMNSEMWDKPAVARNVKQLESDGATMISPTEGWLSCRTVGAGRMAEPESIFAAISDALDG